MSAQGVFITGTDTGVGKTWIGSNLCAYLYQNDILVTPRKPVESGCEKSATGVLLPADAYAYFDACNQATMLNTICPYRYEAAIAPDQAAELVGKTLNLEMLVNACTREQADQFLLVEGAGGFYSPIARDALNADLARSLGLPILLVAADRLGAINHTLLTAEAIQKSGLKLVAVVLNQMEMKAHENMDNAESLEKYLDCPVLSVAYQAEKDMRWKQQLTILLLG
ncbi:MAG TPA: dethiobiotin synthase [Chromatiales bacterium]|nr:dethiobiotin synthase [Thiotrichales bacterium]HIP69134.1 dethiobiotin synthase [Chromatiales bacterium]